MNDKRSNGVVETLLGPSAWRLLTGNALAKAFLRVPVPARDVMVASAFALLVFVPWLGAVGLWDCWEPHYGEVARSMLARHDYVYPWWESTNFLSKPIGLMWLEVIPMLLAGTHSAVGPVGLYTEWCMRFPVMLFAATAVGMLTYAMGKTFDRRVGLIAGFALATSPLYFFLARQAITDMPFVSCMVIGVCWFALAEFDPALWGSENTPPDGTRAAWRWYAFYTCVAVAVLFKALLPAGLVGIAILIYLVASGDWAMLKRARIPSGLLIVASIIGPWIALMCLFPGRDEEGEVFLHRYFVHDQFNRLFVGVHTTTPKDSTDFTYFIAQLGFGLFPWVALVPGAVVAAARGTANDSDPRRRLTFFLGVLVVATFGVLSASATEFHHYGFPVIPPLCVLFALFADDVWENGLEGNNLAILAGLVLFGLVAQNLFLKPKHLADLFVYEYNRPYPSNEIDPAAKNAFAVIFGGGGVALVASWAMREKKTLFAAFGAVALVFALYTSWVHWRRLSFHWSQRDIFWTYYEDACPRGIGAACNPEAPIAAYQMNWRGETFYSQNRVRQIKDPAKLLEFVAQPGREYVIVEQGRYPGMLQTLGDHYRARILDKSSNKFFLVSVD